MCSILRVNSNVLIGPMYPFVVTLYVQYTKNPVVKKWLPFELIYAVYLEYIVASHFVQSYLIILTL